MRDIGKLCDELEKNLGGLALKYLKAIMLNCEINTPVLCAAPCFTAALDIDGWRVHLRMHLRNEIININAVWITAR